MKDPHIHWENLKSENCNRILRALPQACRDKLADCLNEASYDVIASLKGIEPAGMSALFGVGGYGYSFDELQSYIRQQGIGWPRFEATSEGLRYCPAELMMNNYCDEMLREGCDDEDCDDEDCRDGAYIMQNTPLERTPQDLTHQVFTRASALRALLRLFKIQNEEATPMTTLRQELDTKTEAYDTLLAKVEGARAVFEDVIARSVTDNGGNAWADDHHRLLGVFNAYFPKAAVSADTNTETS